MTLPRPPISANTPIPNQPFASEEVYYLEGNQGHFPLGPGLYINPATGQFTNIEPSPYIYCTPQYSNLPVTYPPYGCETEVNTEGVTSLEFAWLGCSSLTSFPCINASSVTNFSQAWEFCFGLTSFPPIDTSSGVNFYSAWYNCNSLTTFPLLNVSSGVDFSYAWSFCESLTTFPPLELGLGVNFEETWFGCSNLTSFPAGMFDNCSATNFSYAWSECALNQKSVDNILISLDTSGQLNGSVDIERGTSSAPGSAGLAAKASLQARGWTVTTN